MEQFDFEWVERTSGNSERSQAHEDDADSLGVISLEDTASEECGTPSAAAVITALEEITARPCDQLQDIINEAMASVHGVAPTSAMLQQLLLQRDAEDNTVGCDGPTAASEPGSCVDFSTEERAASANAHAARETSAGISAPTHTTNTDEPTNAAVARPGSGSTIPHNAGAWMAVLVLLGACGAAAAAALLLLVARSAAYHRAQHPASLALYKAVLQTPVRYGHYTAMLAMPTPACYAHYTAMLAMPMPARYAHFGAAAGGLTSGAAQAVCNNSAAGTASSAAAAAVPAKPHSSLAAVHPANMMLSCPKEWQCHYSKLQLANLPAGATKASSALMPLATPARPLLGSRGSCCQAAAAAAAGTQCRGRSTNMSAAHSMCTYLWAFYVTKPTAAAAGAAAKSSAQCALFQHQLQLQQLPLGVRKQPSNTTTTTTTTSSSSSKMPRLPAAMAGSLTAATDQAANAAASNSTRPAATAATPVWRISKPAKPVPPLYHPAPPCLVVTMPLPRKQRMAKGGATSYVQSRSSTTAAPKSAAAHAASASHKPMDFAVLKRLIYKAASYGGGLTLPMLPPLVYPQPAVQQQLVRSTGSNQGGSNASTAGSGSGSTGAAAAQAAGPSPGLSLPMLPPIKGHKEVAGGITLPMLPPITCSTCGSHLQHLAPADQQPMCPASTPRTCTATQQQYRQYKLQYSQRYLLLQRQPKERGPGTSATSCTSSGVLLVHMPPAAAAAASSGRARQQSSGSGASAIGQQLRLSSDGHLSAQEAALFARAAPALAAPANSTNGSLDSNTNATTSGGLSSSSSSSSSNSSSLIGGAFASGSWVATWVSFPMLLPVELDTPSRKQQQQQQQQQEEEDNDDAAHNPRPAVQHYRVISLKPRAPASSASACSAALNHKAAHAAKAVSAGISAATAPHKKASKATKAVQAGWSAAAGPAGSSSPPPAAAISASLHGWAAQVNANAAALLQPAQKVMQIVGTARSRSLQCTLLPAGEGSSGSDAFGSRGPAGRGTVKHGSGSGGPGGNAAFAANNAAYVASRQLFSAAIALEKASWPAARTAAPHAGVQQQLQSLCAAVGHAHRELKTTLAAAVFKQQTSHSSSAAAPAAFCSFAQPVVATTQPAAHSNVWGSAHFAIPLGPVGGLEATTARRPQGHAPAVKPIAASAHQGPLLPVKQQLVAHTHTAGRVPTPPAVPDAQGPVHAAASLTGAAKAQASASGGVWMLNLGWDESSACALAEAAAELGEAEGGLQRACRHLVAAV